MRKVKKGQVYVAYGKDQKSFEIVYVSPSRGTVKTSRGSELKLARLETPRYYKLLG